MEKPILVFDKFVNSVKEAGYNYFVVKQKRKRYVIVNLSTDRHLICLYRLNKNNDAVECGLLYEDKKASDVYAMYYWFAFYPFSENEIRKAIEYAEKQIAEDEKEYFGCLQGKIKTSTDYISAEEYSDCYERFIRQKRKLGWEVI